MDESNDQLRGRIATALTADDPIDEVLFIIASEQSRALRMTAEFVRNVGRRCRGNPGDRHRRQTANACAELLIRRNREIYRAAFTTVQRSRRAHRDIEETQ